MSAMNWYARRRDVTPACMVSIMALSSGESEIAANMKKKYYICAVKWYCACETVIENKKY